MKIARQCLLLKSGSRAAALHRGEPTTPEGGVKPPLHGGQEFGGLDAARGQVGDKFAIGNQKIVIGKLARERPRDLLEHARRGVRLSTLGSEEMDLEFFGSAGVTVADTGDFDGFGDRHAKLFAEFTDQRLFKRFPRANFPAGEFPLKGRSVAAAALADEYAAVGTFDNGGDDVDHGKDNSRSNGAIKQSDAPKP
jgi:hypothetical protein